MVEPLRNVDPLSGKRETGRLAYETANSLVERITQLSEFQDALARALVKPKGEAKTPINSISFKKGDYRYELSYSSKATSISEEAADEATDMRFRLRKFRTFFPGASEDEIAELNLHSWYLGEGETIDFIGGSILLSSKVKPPIAKIDQEAVDLLPQYFGDILLPSST